MKTLNVIKVVGLVFSLLGIDSANSMSVNTDILKLNVTQQSILKKPEDLQTVDGSKIVFNYKNDVENIQPSDISKDNDSELEETFHRASINFKTSVFTSEDIESPTIKPLEDHHLALIIGVFLMIACIGLYGVLITWRYYIEKRYGMMEQLVTEDDYYNNNDVRHMQF